MKNLIRYADFDPKSGYEQMKSLLASRQKFTAIFVASDNVAMGAYAALHEAGIRIPADISVVGFDDIPWAEYSDPPLTTMRLDAQELARKSLFCPDGFARRKRSFTKKTNPGYGACHP